MSSANLLNSDAKPATLHLKKNDKFSHTGSYGLAKAAQRYGFDANPEGFIFASKGPGSVVLRANIAGQTADATEVETQNIGNDLEYVVDVKVGTPGVTLQLDFDTGSSDCWVWSSELSAHARKGHDIYDPSKSSTSKKIDGATWEIHYGDNSWAKGVVYDDTLQLGDLTIKNQGIEAATKVSKQFVQDQGNDGLLGLAFDKLNTVKPNPVKTPFTNLVNQKLLKQALFTVKLVNWQSSEKGFYTFGAIDETALQNPLSYTPIDNADGFWKHKATSFTIGGVETQIPGGKAISDTGTSLLILPASAVKAFYASIPGARLDPLQGGYVFPQNAEIPPVTFGAGDQQYTINPENLKYGKPDSNGNVYGGVQSGGNLPFAIYGDAFLKNVYVVFDYGNNQIGFSQRDTL
ncbi:acid protease [Meredithblackwellia eburnea MCA 4105]